jgi:transcriptional regulator with XRE-family HTH domain
MNAEEYRTERLMRGTQKSVAEQLGVRQATISDRERGRVPITEEARRALLSLPKIRELNPPAEEIVGAMNSGMPQARYNQVHAWVVGSYSYLCGIRATPVKRCELESVSCLRCRKTLAIRQREKTFATGPPEAGFPRSAQRDEVSGRRTAER